MRQAEINALMRAHKNRARPVAFLHILRQPSLEPDDQAFLLAHINELGGTDLLRWKVRCDEGGTGVIIRRLAEIAVEDPAQFQHELLTPMSRSLAEPEWLEIADLLRGKVPQSLWGRICDRGREAPAPEPPPAAAAETIDLSSLGLFDEDEGGGGLFGDLGGDDFLGGPTQQTPNAESRVSAALEALKAAQPAARTEVLAEQSERLTTSELLELNKADPLLFNEEELAEIALARAALPDEDWSPILEAMPIQLEEAVLEKLRRSARDEERAGLLEWLSQNATPLKLVLDAVVKSMEAGELRQGTLAWLAKTLATKGAWEKNGAKILWALFARRAFGEMADLVTLVWSQTGSTSAEATSAKKTRRSGGSEAVKKLLEAMHFVFASTLIAITLDALNRGDEDQAMSALSALACLHPPARVSRPLRALRKSSSAKGEVLALLDVNERLVKQGDARDASFEGIVAAIHALADASA